MSEKSNGGPAFPGSSFQNDSDVNLTAPNGQVVAPGDWIELPGMTMRDYFAAKALQGAIHHRGFATVDENRNMDAKDAYAYADAMLRAREA